jgi:hypothetical protein
VIPTLAGEKMPMGLSGVGSGGPEKAFKDMDADQGDQKLGDDKADGKA